MLDTFKIYQELASRMDQAAAEGITNILGQIYEDLQNTVTRDDLALLIGVVRDLGEAQKRSEGRLDRLEQVVAELAEAQVRMAKRLEELVDAQKATERRLFELIGEVNDIKVQLGGLAMAVGYGIEDRLMPLMKRFVPKIYGASVQRVERKNVRYSKSDFDEVNLYIEALKDGQPVLIAGECKAQPGKKDLRRFNSMLKRLSEHFKMPVEGFIVGYLFSPDVEDLLAQDYPQIKAFKTYEVEIIATEEDH